MTIPTQVKWADQGKARRYALSLRLSWRVLGNRDLCYGEATLKDISTGGLALQVDQRCPRGTVVIVQFEEAEKLLGEPMLLQAKWSRKLPQTIGGTRRYLMGCSFTTPLQEKDLEALFALAENAAATPDLPKEASAKTPAPVDSAWRASSEKRSAPRRGGFAVPVVVSRAEGGPSVEASVVDRSLKGLGILSRR